MGKNAEQNTLLLERKAVTWHLAATSPLSLSKDAHQQESIRDLALRCGKIGEMIDLAGFALRWRAPMAFFNLLFALVSLLLIGCIPGLLFGAGLLIAFAGFWALRKEFSISKHGLVVPGTVIAINARRKRKAIVYDTVVRFQVLDGADPLTFVVNTGSFQVYQVDQPVRVIYLPADLKSARIAGRMRWVGPYVGIGFGLFFAALTVILSLSLITVHH